MVICLNDFIQLFTGAFIILLVYNGGSSWLHKNECCNVFAKNCSSRRVWVKKRKNLKRKCVV